MLKAEVITEAQAIEAKAHPLPPSNNSTKNQPAN